MKRFTKILGVGLLMAPCMLAFTACGGKGLVDTSGKYSEITKEAIVEETDAMDMTSIQNGFKIIVNSEVKAEGEKAKSKITIHAAGDNKLSMTMEADGITMNIYYVNNTVYMNYNGVKVQQPAEDMGFDEIVSGNNGFIGDQIDFKGLLDNLNTIQDQTKYTVEKAEKGTSTKYHISIAGDALTKDIVGDMSSILPGSNIDFGTYNFWLVFKNNSLAGLKTTVNASTTYMGVKMSLSTTLELVGSPDQIKFPDDLASYPTERPNLPM